MKIATIRSSWMPGYGYRLDCQPYVGGALETRALLEALPLRKDPLRLVVKAVYHAGREARKWVEAREFGVPFMSSSDVLKADLSDLPLISKAQVARNPQFTIRTGFTLITRSGTIGRMAYARQEMDGIACSEHVLRVVPNPERIRSGYLYAFLSSQFGVPLVTSGTYGAIIQAIEPEHLLRDDFRVPRLDDALEEEIHELVEEAARLRSLASKRKQEAIDSFVSLCELPDLPSTTAYPRPFFGQTTSGCLSARLDSTYYIAPCLEARAAFDAAGARWRSKSLGDVAEVFIPTIFKRLYADDPAFGYPYITGADVFHIKPTSNQFLMREVAHENRLLLEDGMIVLHEAGQRYGLIGRSVMVGRTLHGFACTNNMVRLAPHDPSETGFIFAALSSEFGIRLLKREAAGSSIPHLDEKRIAAVEIPWPDAAIRARVAKLAHEAREYWDRGDELENEADSKLKGALK